jgi:hypothetical protein
MNISKGIGCVALMMLVFLMAAPMASGDVYWESEQVSKGVPGQPDGTKTVKTYYTANAIRTEAGDFTTIMDLDAMMMYQLNATAKTYTQVKMDQIAMPGMDEKQAQAIQEMMKKMMEDIKITPTTETKKIAGYNCTKYNMTMMGATNDYWLSKEVKEYEELKAISAKMIEIFARNPILKQMNIMGMMDKLDGFPVQMIINVMGGGSITTTLKHIEKTTVDKNLFKTPEEYKLQQVSVPKGK